MGAGRVGSLSWSAWSADVGWIFLSSTETTACDIVRCFVTEDEIGGAPERRRQDVARALLPEFEARPKNFRAEGAWETASGREENKITRMV